MSKSKTVHQLPAKNIALVEKPIWLQWLPILIAVTLAAIPFLYGKYLEFGTDGPFDGGMNVYTAKQIINGGRIGVDVFPSARPATLLVNVIGVALFGFNETGSKLIQMLMQLAGLGLMFYALRRVYGTLPAAVALVLAAFFLSCPPYAKFGNVKEQYMVACMLIAASALLIRHAGGAWWWLLIAGGAAINSFFFKPTGASVIAAMMVYVFIQPLLRWQTFLRFAGDIGLGMLIVWAAAINCFFFKLHGIWIIAAMILYVILQPIIRRRGLRLPYIELGLLILGLLITGTAALNGVFFKQMGFWFFAAMVLCLIVQPIIRRYSLLLIAGGILGLLPLMIFALQQHRLGAFLREIPGVAYLFPAPGAAAGGGGFGGEYIAGSRQVSDFKSQWADVFRYLHSFVIPLGLAFFAIGAWKVQWFQVIIGKFRNPKSQTPNPKQIPINPNKSENLQTNPQSAIHNPQSKNPHADTTAWGYNPQSAIRNPQSFVLLLAIWFLLDLAFIWISPRNYVEYYLPFNASAAMLAAYAVYRCRQNPALTLGLMISWVLTQTLILWLAPPDRSFPYLHLWPSGPAAYLRYLLPGLIPLALALAAWFLLRPPLYRNLRGPLLLLLAAIMPLMLAWRNPPAHGSLNLLPAPLHQFSEKVAELDQQRQAEKELGSPVTAWEQLGDYIRAHSQPADPLYVWGWYPGIYVRAQRFSPTKEPSCETMHSDNPELIKFKVANWVKELKQNPPKFIVDSQKVHYPFYDHPVFDFWPKWYGQKGRFELHNGLMLPANPDSAYLTPSDEREYRHLYLEQVEELSYQLMVNPRRPGGPLPATDARELAKVERQRHEALMPLRDYVTENYLPVNLSRNIGMDLFMRKTNP